MSSVFLPWIPPDDTWRQRAACEGMDPRLFFPKIGQSSEAGKKVCRECPVKAQCGEFATVNGEHGVWGETTKGQRTKRLRKVETKTYNVRDRTPEQEALAARKRAEYIARKRAS